MILRPLYNNALTTTFFVVFVFTGQVLVAATRLLAIIVSAEKRVEDAIAICKEALRKAPEETSSMCLLAHLYALLDLPPLHCAMGENLEVKASSSLCVSPSHPPPHARSRSHPFDTSVVRALPQISNSLYVALPESESQGEQEA